VQNILQTGSDDVSREKITEPKEERGAAHVKRQCENKNRAPTIFALAMRSSSRWRANRLRLRMCANSAS
jgi:hypothetical protein